MVLESWVCRVCRVCSGNFRYRIRISRFMVHKFMKAVDCTSSRKGQKFPPTLPTEQSCGSSFQPKLPLPSPVVAGWYRIIELDRI